MGNSRFSKSIVAPLALFLTLPVLAWAQSGNTGNNGNGNNGNSNGTFSIGSQYFLRLPLLVYTMSEGNQSGTGATSSGDTGATTSSGTSLVVYSDGLVTLGGTGLTPDSTLQAQTAQMTAAEAFQLAQQIRQAGGLRRRVPLSSTALANAGDQPVITVTVFYYPDFQANNGGNNGGGTNGNGNGNGNGIGNTPLNGISEALTNTWSYITPTGAQISVDGIVRNLVSTRFGNGGGTGGNGGNGGNGGTGSTGTNP